MRRCARVSPLPGIYDVQEVRTNLAALGLDLLLEKLLAEVAEDCAFSGPGRLIGPSLPTAL